MPIGLNSNVSSLNTQRWLQRSTTSLQESFEKLSSGLRINKASDDAAGLAIATSLRTDSRVYTQGVRNLNDGLSLYSIAEGAVTQLSTIVTRIRELAEQSSNGTIANKQRGALDAEADALASEYNRIVSTTSFNGQNLIDGTLTSLNLQNGYGQNGSVQLSVGEQLKRNIGDGTFNAALQLGTGAFPYTLTATDIDHDGKVDIITADITSSSLSVFKGNGDGTFLARTVFATNSQPNGIDVSDFNGDGRVDVVVSNQLSGTFSVLLGNGDASFNAPVAYSTNGGATTIIAADLNQDGIKDIVTGNFVGSNIGVSFGNGDGSFRARSLYVMGNSNYGIQVADFNSDGLLDISSSDAGTGTLRVMLGTGGGSFGPVVSYVEGANVEGDAVGDLNGDGNIDFIGAVYAGGVGVLLGNSDGTFRSSTSFATSSSLAFVKTADIDGDGILDLVTSDHSTGPSVLFGNGDGTFRAFINSPVFSGGTGSAVTADLNGDGRLDISFAGFGTNSLNILIGNGGTSSFLPQINLNSKSAALSTLDAMQSALDRITSELGSEGASESRLQTATTNLQTIRENFDRAASQILDVDVASEAAVLTRQEILQKGASAILAQANSQPQIVLQLLRG